MLNLLAGAFCIVVGIWIYPVHPTLAILDFVFAALNFIVAIFLDFRKGDI